MGTRTLGSGAVTWRRLSTSSIESFDVTVSGRGRPKNQLGEVVTFVAQCARRGAQAREVASGKYE